MYLLIYVLTVHPFLGPNHTVFQNPYSIKFSWNKDFIASSTAFLMDTNKIMDNFLMDKSLMDNFLMEIS